MLKKLNHPDDPPPGGPPPEAAPEPGPVAEDVEPQETPETPVTAGVDGLNARLDELEAWRNQLTAEHEEEKAAHRKHVAEKEKTHDQAQAQATAPTEPKPRPGFKRLRFLRGTRKPK